jgi:hypothetical protein
MHSYVEARSAADDIPTKAHAGRVNRWRAKRGPHWGTCVTLGFYENGDIAVVLAVLLLPASSHWDASKADGPASAKAACQESSSRLRKRSGWSRRPFTHAAALSEAVPSWLSLGAGVGEAVAVGAGLDDVPAEGEAVDDGGAEPGSVKGFVQPLKLSLLAIATAVFSARSVRTWKSSSAPRLSSSM